MVGLAEMGERDRLDGIERYQPSFGLHRAGDHHTPGMNTEISNIVR